MSLKGCASTLGQASRELSSAWDDARNFWRDAKAVEFDREYLSPLPPMIAKSMEAMEELERVLGKARKDCA